ncbi:uncharacterized protein LOC108027762 isoform X2 [Drosophila biarmipes]|nr:uncharacterized protein LOC108027762 isoform X2 [Drosophila biarmipes]
MNSRTWSASRGPAPPPPPSIGVDQWQVLGQGQGQGHGPKPNPGPSQRMQSIINQALERGVSKFVCEQLATLSGARCKWFYRYVDLGLGPKEALSKTLERMANTAGFKGGALKWYEKYIASGCTEKEAREKVLEYQRNNAASRKLQGSQQAVVPDDRGRKRPIDNKDSIGGRAKEEPKKPRRSAESPPRKNIVMAVMPDKYPACVLSKKQLSRIEAALVEEMRKGWKTSINFGGIQFLPGLILVTCIDRNTKKWLEHVVPNIAVVQGITLTTRPETEIPATKGITVLVPRSADEPDNITTELLIDQNTDLLSKTWQVVRSTTTKEGNKVVTITLSDKSFELLQLKGLTVSYRFSQLSCRPISGKEALRTVRVNYAEPRPPPPPKNDASQSSEIDLTEDDSEEFISQLNLVVVDEVKGDEDDENEEAPEGEADGEHDDQEIAEGHDEEETAEGEHDEEDTAEGEYVEHEAAEGENVEEEAAEGEPEESYEVEGSVGDDHEQEEEVENAGEEENQHGDGEEAEAEGTTIE